MEVYYASGLEAALAQTRAKQLLGAEFACYFVIDFCGAEVQAKLRTEFLKRFTTGTEWTYQEVREFIFRATEKMPSGTPPLCGRPQGLHRLQAA